MIQIVLEQIFVIAFTYFIKISQYTCDLVANFLVSSLNDFDIKTTTACNP